MKLSKKEKRALQILGRSNLREYYAYGFMQSISPFIANKLCRKGLVSLRKIKHVRWINSQRFMSVEKGIKLTHYGLQIVKGL